MIWCIGEKLYMSLEKLSNKYNIAMCCNNLQTVMLSFTFFSDQQNIILILIIVIQATKG